MCHTAHRQRNYHSPLIGLPASTSPCLYTSTLCTKEGFFFKSMSAAVTSCSQLYKGFSCSSMVTSLERSHTLPFLPTTLPSPLLQPPAASSHTWPPKTEPLFPKGSVCPVAFLQITAWSVTALPCESGSRISFKGGLSWLPYQELHPLPFCLILPSVAPVTI